MENNVLTWLQALRKGYEPSLYFYDVGQVPLGEYEAVLDFKIWAKKVMAVNCYFTRCDTSSKMQLTVFCQSRGVYVLKDCPVNFATCATELCFRVKVTANEKKRIVFESAVLLGESKSRDG